MISSISGSFSISWQKPAVLGLTLAIATFAGACLANAASFGDLGSGAVAPPAPSFQTGAYANPPAMPCPPACAAPAVQSGTGPEGVYPVGPDTMQPFIPAYQLNPRAYLPLANGTDMPNTQTQLWTFGQLNSGTDPFNPWGLSTPYMFVPWSTPLTGWTNAQTWNWWRERSGALPRNW